MTSREVRKFETTQAEKDAPSYFDWDDARLGQFTKHLAKVFDGLSDDAEGFHRSTLASCAMLLIGAAHDTNAGELELKMEGNTHDGKEIGDWTVTVKCNRGALSTLEEE